MKLLSLKKSQSQLANNVRHPIGRTRPSNREGRIHVISLEKRGQIGISAAAAPAHDIFVEGWTNLFNLNWAAGSAGWYVCSHSGPAGSTFLYVDLKEDATPKNGSTPSSDWRTVENF